jgi:hypothetical protein
LDGVDRIMNKQGNKYVPHTGLKQINKGRKRMGLEPLNPIKSKTLADGQTLTLTVPDLGEIKVDR